jgi:hypothetical protein
MGASGERHRPDGSKERKKRPALAPGVGPHRAEAHSGGRENGDGTLAPDSEKKARLALEE